MIGIGAFFTAILAKFGAVLAWVAALAVLVFAALWLLGTDLGAWIFEQVLDVAISALNSITFSSETFNPSTYIAALPVEIGNMLALLRVGECFTIIAAAVVLKLLLQLVPFTRLGS